MDTGQTSTDISIGRTHGKGSHAEDSLDDLTSPAQLSHDLFVGQGSQRLKQDQ